MRLFLRDFQPLWCYLVCSICISLIVSEMGQAFTVLSDEEFSAKYDFKRPGKSGDSKKVVTTCQLGTQAASAADQLLRIGYENVAVYKGSFMDWKAQGNKIITGDMDKDRLVDFNQVKEAINNSSQLVIDVRNLKERSNPGYIAGVAYCVPRA